MTQQQLLETLDRAESAIIVVSDALMVIWTCIRTAKALVPRLPKALFPGT